MSQNPMPGPSNAQYAPMQGQQATGLAQPHPSMQPAPPPGVHPQIMRNPNEFPILIWMLSLNREYTEEVCCYLDRRRHQLTRCRNMMLASIFSKNSLLTSSYLLEPQKTLIHSVRTSSPIAASYLIAPLGFCITQLLPVLMMRHRRIPRSKWRDCVSIQGKHWIEQVSVPHGCRPVTHSVRPDA